MNYFDLIIGLGLGVLIALIVRAVIDARKEASERNEKLRQETNATINRTKDEYSGNLALSDRMIKLESLHPRMKLLVEHVAELKKRVDDLEPRRK